MLALFHYNLNYFLLCLLPLPCFAADGCGVLDVFLLCELFTGLPNGPILNASINAVNKNTKFYKMTTKEFKKIHTNVQSPVNSLLGSSNSILYLMPESLSSQHRCRPTKTR